MARAVPSGEASFQQAQKSRMEGSGTAATVHHRSAPSLPSAVAEDVLLEAAIQKQLLATANHLPRRSAWCPPGKHRMMKGASPLYTFIGSWEATTPLSSWVTVQTKKKMVPSASVDAIITRLTQPHRSPPKPPAIRVHPTQTGAYLRPPPAAKKNRPPSPVAAAWRSAPTLGSGKAHHRSAPQLSRKLPEGATAKLLPDHMRRALIEYARTQDKELVLLIEMRPVTTQTLHQREDQYRHFAQSLATELGDNLCSTRRPELAAFSAVTVRRPPRRKTQRRTRVDFQTADHCACSHRAPRRSSSRPTPSCPWTRSLSSSWRRRTRHPPLMTSARRWSWAEMESEEPGWIIMGPTESQGASSVVRCSGRSEDDA